MKKDADFNLSRIWRFPGGIVGRNLPAHAGDMGAVLGPGRFHRPSSDWDQAQEPASHKYWAYIPQLPYPAHSVTCES